MTGSTEPNRELGGLAKWAGADARGLADALPDIPGARHGFGPGLAGPGRRGFGSVLLERLVRLQPAGSLERVWDPAGLCCTVILPDVLVRPGRSPWA